MKKRSLLFIPLVFVFLLLFLKAQGQDSQSGDQPKPKYVGAEECADCHSHETSSFFSSVHGMKMDPRTPAAKHACESCHGPGDEHAKAQEATEEEVLKGPIVQLGPKAPTSMRKQNEVCLECHSTSKLHLFWQGSKHEQRGVGCVSCHAVHDRNMKLLGKPDQISTCTQCHMDIKAQIQMPFHHPIREGSLQCTDCHNPHGSVAPRLIAANEINEKCYQCHADKRGPFLYEHPPASENCLNCHTPHGSAHDFLLSARLPWLCQRCHSGEGHQGILYTLNMFPPAVQGNVYNLRPQLYNRSCWQCHVAVHGSNSASGETLLR